MTVSGETTAQSTVGIHRLLDEAYAGIEMTPEVQDLKEEMRGDLLARVADLVGDGLAPDAAARRAIAELGDVRPIVEEIRSVPGASWQPARVRPKPGFLVRTILFVAVGLSAAAVVVLGGLGWSAPLTLLGAAVAVAALSGGTIVADSLRQETTGNYPLPPTRALGFGAASTLALAGAGIAALYRHGSALPWFIGGGLALLTAIVLFTVLGATQTNRHKPWVVRRQTVHGDPGDRFTEDPAAAARFGLYTVVIWTVTLAGFAALTITIGWTWSWLALVGGVVTFLLTLSRMLFGERPATH